MKNWEAELPTGYRESLVIDAKNYKRLLLRMNLAALVAPVLFLCVGFVWLCRQEAAVEYTLWRSWAFMLALVLYIVLHELVHGAAYKALTGQKLTFGLTLTVAFCGVPQIYVYRKAALIAVLAPFVVFTIVFGLAAGLLRNVWDQFYAFTLLGLHIGGCTGDLYNTWLYLTRFKDTRTLTRDTGPIQMFYVPEV